MKLKTRVLSLVLAGSMMLSVVPVSAFAETGTANAASAAVQSDVPANGVYDTEQPGSILISARGCSIKSQDDVIYRSNSCYVVNSHDDQAIPRLTILYGVITDDMPKGHKVIAWRVSMPGKSTPSYGYTDQGQISQLKQLAEVGYEESDNHKTVSFNCVRSVTYNGMALAAIDSPVYFNPVLNVTADDLTFDHAILSLGRSFSSEAVTLHQKFIKVQPDGNVDFNDSSSILTEFPKEAGTYQAFATLSSNFTDPRVPSWNGERYYEIDAKQILTSNDWRFTVNSDISLSVNENGQPVIPDGTTGVHYSGSTLTIDDGNTVHFGYGTPVKCNIENNGVLDGGLFTGTVTGSGSILSGLFVNKPEGADSMLYSFTSGTTFAGMKDTSGTTTLYLVRADGGQDVPLSVSYENSSRQAHGWLLFLNIGLDSNYVLVQNPWTFSNNINVAIPSALANASAVYTPVACMNASDLSIDSTGNVRVSLPDVEVSGVKYTSTDGKTYENYPSDPGTYTATVSLESTRNWQVLVSSSSSLALTGEDAIAVQAENEKWTNRVVGSQDGLYYYVPETLDVKVTVKQSAPASSVVTLTVNENGAPVIPADAKGVRYEGNTLTIDANTTARFAQGSTVKCDIVNNGTLDGGLFTGTVTGSGSIARGLFLHDPKAASNTMMLSVPENASLNGITEPDATGLTTLYAINTLDGENNELLFIGDYIGTDPHTFYGWDLVYSLGDEENSDVEKNYIGHTHFEQPMYGPIPDGMNGVRCIFLPVLEMNASDLTITADKTESKIDGAVIALVQYVDESDPNAAPSSVYPTKAGSYKAIVTLTCPGDSTYSKARVARIGNLCYHVPETLEVEVTVELPTVPPTDGDGNVTFEGTDEVKGDGWTAKKDDEGKTTVEITDGKNLNNTTLNCNKITIGSEGTSTTVSNLTTSADVTVASGSAIEGGTFSGNVSGTGTIEGGTFSGNVGSEVKINGGVFANEPTNTTAPKAKVIVTGGATVNNLKNDGNDESRSSTVTVVTGKEQTIQLSAEIEGRTFYGWKETAGSNDPTLNPDSSITIHENDETERTFTPVVVMNEKDLTAAGESKITGVTVTSLLYYPVNDAGEITGEGSAERPTEDGSYILVAMLELSSQEPSENGIALFAAENTDLSRVVEQDGIGYYVPESLTVERITNGEDVPSDTGSGDSGAGGAAVAVIGGAAIGGAAYLIGTQVYLTSVLPEGASIPTNRQQLADLLWTAAGKPQPASTALFTDISAEAADSQKAARWCVEQGLLKDTGSTFKPDKHTFRPQVIKAWNDLQAKLNPQK